MTEGKQGTIIHHFSLYKNQKTSNASSRWQHRIKNRILFPHKSEVNCVIHCPKMLRMLKLYLTSEVTKPIHWTEIHQGL